MTAFSWNGPNPSIGWPGDLNWNEPRNWNFQNPALGPVFFPTNGDDAGFGFSPPGVVTGTIAFQNCSAGSFTGTVQVQLSGVNCISGYLDATGGSEIDVVSGSGTLTANMQGGNVGSSGTLNGGTFDIQRTPALGGGVLLQTLIDFPVTHRGANTIAAIMGSVTGFSPLSVGAKGPFSPSTNNAELDVFGGGPFTGGVSSIYPFGFIFPDPAKLNLKSMSAAGAAGEPIRIYGGQVTFTVPAWLGHPLILDPANAQAGSLDALIANGASEGGIPLVYLLPDARTVGIKNSGADWRVYCTVDVHQFSGGFGNVNGFAGILDDVRVTTGAALTILKVKGKHFYGKLTFDAGGKVEF